MTDIGTPVQLNEKSRIYYYPYEKENGEVCLITTLVPNVTELIVRPLGTHRLKADGKLVIMPSGWVRIDVEAEDWTI
jgi:hypothetical protein